KGLYWRVGGIVAISVLSATGPVGGAEAPPAPALSTLVPVDDHVGPVDVYMEGLEECVEEEAEFADSVNKMQRRSNSLAVVALAIGLHDQDHPLRKAAPGLIRACQQLSSAKDFSGAVAALAQLKSALNSSGDPSTLRWVKVADMSALMNEVPQINTRMKSYIRKFDRSSALLAGRSGALVAISQGSLANAGDTIAPDKAAEWYKHCVQMRDAASALNRAAHEKDPDTTEKAMDALQQSCEDCHAIFHPIATGPP
ncbi:MAG: hypothetical protein ACYC6Y_13065, partial [Thermoguttaceae bacterium]